MVILNINVLIRSFVYRIECIEVGCRVVFILVKEVPRSRDTGRHVIQTCLGNGAIVHEVSQVATEVRVSRVESDVTRHRHLIIREEHISHGPQTKLSKKQRRTSKPATALRVDSVADQSDIMTI